MVVYNVHIIGTIPHTKIWFIQPTIFKYKNDILELAVIFQRFKVEAKENRSIETPLSLIMQ